MALPVHPNAITLNDIQTEFGGTNPISLSEYYSGGANVPANTKGYPGGVETTIPASGAISLANFHGASAVTYPNVVFGADFSFQAFDGLSPYNSSAYFDVETTGDYARFVNLNGTSKGTLRADEGDWVDTKTGLTASDFEVSCTVVSGTLNSGTTGSYTTLSSDQSWGISLSGTGSKTTIIDVTVRQISNTSNSDTIRVTLNCLNEPF